MAMPNDTFTDYDTLLEARATALAKQAAPPQQEELPTYGYSELVERRTRRESNHQVTSSNALRQTSADHQATPPDNKRKISLSSLFKRKGSSTASVTAATTTKSS